MWTVTLFVETDRRHGPSARRIAHVLAAVVRRARVDFDAYADACATRSRACGHRRNRAARMPDRTRRLDERELRGARVAVSISRSARAHGGRPTDFREGFVLWRGIGVNYEGGGARCARARGDPDCAPDRCARRVLLSRLARAQAGARPSCAASALRSACCCSRRWRLASATSSSVCRCRLRPRTTGVAARCCFSSLIAGARARPALRSPIGWASAPRFHFSARVKPVGQGPPYVRQQAIIEACQASPANTSSSPSRASSR